MINRIIIIHLINFILIFRGVYTDPSLTKGVKLPHRPNIVEEVPTLDVGPLVEVTVAEDGVARLPCTHAPANKNDVVTLVLWYRNDTTRPFLSYDGRNDIDVNSITTFKYSQNYRRSGSAKKNKDRASLESSGSSLLLTQVQKSDQAEYRCTVHYKMSPSVTKRLQLIVTDRVTSVQLLDSARRPLGSHVGPLSAGEELHLSCKATYSGEFDSLVWLINGEKLASSISKPKDGLVISHLDITLREKHANAALTCRLTTHNKEDEHKTKSISDVSTTILMFYIPEATLLVDEHDSGSIGDDRTSGGASVQITHGQRITFTCAVKSRPPAYNITWMHNGRVVGGGGHRYHKNEKSFVINPVNRDDAGLYTCLASNTEGDGQSNAILLKVAHKPTCEEPSSRHLIVARNTSVFLTCSMSSEPEDVTFTWSMVPTTNMGDKGQLSKQDMMHFASGNLTNQWPLRFQKDANVPTRSHTTLSLKNDDVIVVCYANNRIGRTQVPCIFTLAVVDPPQSPNNCSVTYIAVSRIHVTCDGETDSNYPTTSHPQISPGLSFVRSPQARTTSHLEVWSMGTLVSNMSNDAPTWGVDSLPPDTRLRLRIYTASRHAHSAPVILYTKTKPMPLPPQPIPESNPNLLHNPTEYPTEYNQSPGGEIKTLILVLGLVGGLSAMILMLVTTVLLIRARGRRRSREQSLPPDINSQPCTEISTPGMEEVRELWISTSTLPRPSTSRSQISETIVEAKHELS